MSDTPTPESIAVREWTHDGRPELNRRGGTAPAGPWWDEPDKRHWVDPSTDMDCLMLRNGFGAWCGYVAVTEGHPWFGVSYGQALCDCPEDDYCYEHSPEAKVSVHGGLTYSDFCNESKDGEGHGICHVPLSGRPGRVWWFGFDCNHAGDLAPGMLASGIPAFEHETYRDVAYVQAECADLARQLTAVAA